MRQTILAVVVLSAAGIRRWPSADVVEDLTGELIKGGHNKLVSTIQSLLQNQNAAGWSSDSSALAAAITTLTDEVVATLTSENGASQSKITEKTNDFQIAIQIRESLLEDARAAEQTLGSAVSAEKGKASDYWNRRADLEIDMRAAFEPCKSQESLTDFEHTLTPETSFVCDFSSTNADGCTQKFAQFQSDMLGLVAGLNTSMMAQSSLYSAAVTACSGAINKADTTMQAVTQAYDSWSGQRAVVSQKHIDRRSKVCDSGCPGLSGAIAAECSARTAVVSLNTSTYSDNNVDSLLDRNYELKSLEVVHCLLKQLEDFRDDQFDGSSVDAIVTECQNQQNWDDYELDWETSADQEGECEQKSTEGDDLSALIGSSLCDDNTLSVAFTNEDSKSNSQVPNQQSMYVVGTIPWDFDGVVPTPEKFERLVVDARGSEDLCADWCPVGQKNCLQQTVRTLSCTGNLQVQNLDHLNKVLLTDLSVPKVGDYLTPVSTDRSFTKQGEVQGCL